MSVFGNSKWFLKSKKEKRKANGAPSDGSDDGKEPGLNGSSGCDEDDDEIKVDEEGYVIRKDINHMSVKEDDHFYSSSDSDSDSDGESDKHRRRFKIEIKPLQLANGGPSVSELRNNVKGLSISLNNDKETAGVANNRENGQIVRPSLSKSISSNSVMGPPLHGPPVIPPPPTRRVIQMSPSYSSQSASYLTRCKSYGSLSSDLRMTPVSVNSSRGPSPLTLGMSDVVPIAVAIQECISARFKGSDESKCQVQIIGSLKIAFPAGILQVFANNTCPSLLSFKLSNCSRLDKLLPNHAIVMENKSIKNGVKSESYFFDMNMVGLTSHLRKLCEQSPNSRYYNVEILKYQLKVKGVAFCPLQIVAHWKCEPETTGLRIDYKYNPCAMSSIEPLRNVKFCTTVDGVVKSLKCVPDAAWNAEKKEVTWTVDDVSLKTEDRGLGSLKAKFDVSDGPTTPGVVNIHFDGSGATFSGMDFQLNCGGYRMSLMKKHLLTGRYFSEADSAIAYACV
ncbi:F-BAR domain only protein 2 [Brevipalpus obovatus]|uniref:F-BAR domain only protein 2 n=1 Tax=Brevipalpus obovatus TaxID=246614 RepID=UPI003D9E973C